MAKKPTPIELTTFLRERKSPLADHVPEIMAAANRHRIDPRLIVAIAGGESSFGLHIPDGSFNAWGIGPGRRYTSWTDGINGAAKLLRDGYVGKGLTSLSAIQQKWAPLQAANDPTNLNSNWLRVNGEFYTNLGGNPADVTSGWRRGSSPAAQSAVPTVPQTTPPVWGTTVPQSLGLPGQRPGVMPMGDDPTTQVALQGLSRIAAGGKPEDSLRDLVQQTFAQTQQVAAAKTQTDDQPDPQPAPDGGSYSFKKSGERGPTPAIDKAVDIAVAQVGKPYVFGTEGPNTFDCSGLIEYALAKAGITTPGRLTTYTAVRLGRSVKGQAMQPGDWIIAKGGGHMVMYIGGGQVIAAPRKGTLVQIQPVSRFANNTLDVRRYP